jgi:hypothetical protein
MAPAARLFRAASLFGAARPAGHAAPPIEARRAVRRHLRAAAVGAIALALAACAAPDGVAIPVPAAEADGPPPDLLPLAPLLAAAGAQETGARTSPQVAATLEARAETLRARAAGLRGDVVPAPLRDRLEAGVPRGALP